MHRPIERIAAERGSRGFAWIGLHDPTDDELDEVRDAFDLPELAVADARNDYEPVIDGLTHDVRQVERQVFSEAGAQPTKRIYLLIREVLDFLVALEPLSSAVRQLTSPECMPGLAPEVIARYRDVDDVLSTVVERGRTLHAQLQDVLAASRAESERRQNEDTRKISAWAAIGILPTIVAGFFGMNLGGIPLADHPFGFALVCTLTIVACTLLYRMFKRSSWL